MSFDVQKLARPEIASLEPYRSARGALPDREGMLLLDANENPYACRGTAGTNGFNRYPEPQPSGLLSRLGRYYGVKQEGVLATRGSGEGIDLLVRAFCRPGRDAVIVCPPTFGYYVVAARIQGAEVVEVPLGSGFSLDADGIAKAAAARSVKLIFLCSPNNPTGNDLDRDSILRLVRRLPNSIIVVDEAYIEFSDAESLAGKIAAEPNLVVLRTFSKAFGLAGIRCGALLASRPIIDLLRRIMAPYPVPSPVARAACDGLSPSGLARLAHEVAALRRARDRLASAIPVLSGVREVLPSSANFLLVRFEEPMETRTRLEARGILVRDLSDKIEGALRISVGSDQENEVLLRALGLADDPCIARRTGQRSRSTRETSIFAAVDLDLATEPEVSTGIGFFDHMLEQLAKHGGFALTLTCGGDLKVDPHHTVEDCMITLGGALKDALGSKVGLRRFGFTLPMDEARAEALIDLSGRPFCRFEGDFSAPMVGELPTELVPHAFRSLADNLGAAIHIRVEGENDHHKIEACFKALGRAMRGALRRDGADIPSTKGQL
jgi:histidinol-phosphate aminotransferase/imidazoleglycerol-phosphate dehydratase/histidinol-phosphatase